MIETNLSISHKPTELPVVAGVDLNLVNIKLVVIVIVIGFFLPDMLITPTWQSDLSDIQNQVKTLNVENQKLTKEKSKYRYIEDQIKELQSQETRLKERLNVVRSIIKTRRTPLNILLYLAKNIPEDLWITKLEIKQDKFILDGKSLSFSSVGKFVGSLRNSIFFNKDLKMSSTKSEEDQKTGVRLETFGITASIARFE